MYVTDMAVLIDPSSYISKHGCIPQCSAAIVNLSLVRACVYTQSRSTLSLC